MLKKVHIKNFKSLKDVTLELERNNVLVGPNMSGKSNFLDFFKFVQDLIMPSPGMQPGTHNALNPRNGFRRVAWGGGGENPIIHFALEGESYQDKQKFEWEYDVDLEGNEWGAQVFRENLVIKQEGGSRLLIETKDQQQRNILGAEGQSIAQTRDPSKLALEYNLPVWKGNFLRDSIFSWKFYDLLPPLMRKPNVTAATDFLGRHGENLSAWLMLLQTRYSSSFDRIKSAAKDVFPSLESIFTSPTAQTTVYLASNEKFLAEPMTVAEMSDGELAFLALLSLLYAPFDPAHRVDLYFIEEPENHLHPKLMSVFVDLLRQIQIELPPEKQAQFVITTHSPYLLDKFSIDELVVLSRHEGETVFSRPGNKAELRELVNNEEIGLGDLYYSGALSLA